MLGLLLEVFRADDYFDGSARHGLLSLVSRAGQRLGLPCGRLLRSSDLLVGLAVPPSKSVIAVYQTADFLCHLSSTHLTGLQLFEQFADLLTVGPIASGHAAQSFQFICAAL